MIYQSRSAGFKAEWVDRMVAEPRRIFLGPKSAATTWCADLAAIRLLGHLELQITRSAHHQSAAFPDPEDALRASKKIRRAVQP